MIINSKKFGKTEIYEKDIYTFEIGMPGFPDLHKFTILGDINKEPFAWLQSTEDEETSFILMDVYKILPDYSPLAFEADLDSIDGLESNNLLIYNVVVVPQNPESMSVNLKAPIVLNPDSMKGKQMILKNEDYPVKYYFYKEITKMIGGN